MPWGSLSSSSSSLGKHGWSHSWRREEGAGGRDEGGHGATTMGGFVRAGFVQSSDLGAKNELVGAAGAQPLSQVLGRGGGRVSGAGGLRGPDPSPLSACSACRERRRGKGAGGSFPLSDLCDTVTFEEDKLLNG